MALPAFLDFHVLAVFLFNHHVGIYLVGRFQAFPLEDFQLSGDSAILVMEQFIGLIGIQKGNR